MNPFLRGFVAGLTLPIVPIAAFGLWMSGEDGVWRKAWRVGPGAWMSRVRP